MQTILATSIVSLEVIEHTLENIKTADYSTTCCKYFNNVRLPTLVNYLRYHKDDESFSSIKNASLEDLQWLEEFCKKSKSERHKLLNTYTCKRRYGENYFKEHAAKGRKTKKEHFGKDFDKLMMQKAKDQGLKNDPEMQKHNSEKRSKTKLEKYGKEGISEIARNTAKKATETKRKKYGKDYFKQLGEQSWQKVLEDSEKLENRKYKRDQTLINRYGEHAKTLLWQKSREGLKNSYGKEAYSYIYKKAAQTKLKRYGTIWPNSKNSSKEEKQIVDYIKSIYSGEVLENTFSILNSKKELDIYIPEKKLAIEYNGFFWHSEAVLLRHYSINQILENKTFCYKHLQKTLECEALGIRLIHILDLDWRNPRKQEILKSMIASALSVFDKKYFARKLSFKEIDARLGRQFLEENHLQGAAAASRYFALLDNEKPVQIMSFQLHSYHNRKECELNRMVTLRNCQVLGGFSKLLKNSLKVLNIDSCISYIDRSIFNGKGYYASGFEKVSETEPCYSYIFNGKVYRREFGMRRNIEKLFNQSILAYWNPDETERINMLKNKVPRIWDCGKIKVKFNLKK